MGVTLAACGAGAGSSSGRGGGAAPAPPATVGSTTGVPVSGGAARPALPIAPKTVAPSAKGRLAIGTSRGMEVWSARTGVFTVGPVEAGVKVSDVAWSSDGTYLSWQTTRPGSKAGAELWDADLATGQVRHWGPLAKGASYGQVVVLRTGVLVLGPVIREYRSAAVSPAAVAVKASVPAVDYKAGTPADAWAGGWVVLPALAGGQAAQRIGATGALLPPTARIASGATLDHTAVDLAGRRLAGSLGDGTDTCSTGGSAEVWSVSLRSGRVSHSTPPELLPGAAQRVWSVDVSGPAATLYVATYTCTGADQRDHKVVTPTLWRSVGTGWDHVGVDIVAADQSPVGTLATLAGEVQLGSGGAAVVAGPGSVKVDGKVVATGAQVIRWAP